MRSQDQKISRRRRYAVRYTALAVVFCVICVIFLARLINFQLISRDDYAPAANSGEYVERVYVESLRGNICDRNGKVLVTNETVYGLILNYATIPDTKAEVNEVLLSALYAIDEAGGESVFAKDMSPFAGTYPNMTFSEGFLSDREIYDEFIRLLEKNYVTDDYTLEDVLANESAESVSRYYARKYNIVKEKKGSEFSYTSEFTDEEISRLINIRYEMDRRGFGPDAPFVLAEEITYDFGVYVKELAVSGLEVSESVRRKYNYPGYASHILGLTGQIYAEEWAEYKEKGYDMDAMVGRSGCEAAFEEYLRGTRGIVDVYRDESGMITRTETVREPIAGKDVWLTIDIDVQIAAEDALKENIERIKENASYLHSGEDASAGSVVANDPDTGEIIALASYPTFDLSTYNADYNKLLENKDAPLINRALQSIYAPGSTFKVGMAAAGLEVGTITSHSTYRCDGYYWRYGSTDAFKCAVYPGHHGNIAVEYALGVSCNCFFFETGHYLGIDRMNEWCRLYGLGEHTGIELSEETGILAGEEFRETHPDFCRQNGLGAWQLGDTWQAAIGQSENAFTPLQVSMYISSVINGGTRYSAHLLHSVHEFGDGGAALEKEPTVLNTIPLSSSNVSLIRRAMRSVIHGNEAAYNVYSNFRDAEYEAGGKTGTAQAGSDHSNNGWFTGFAPVNDPQIVVTCMIEHGASGGNSSYTVRKIMDAYLLN